MGRICLGLVSAVALEKDPVNDLYVKSLFDPKNDNRTIDQLKKQAVDEYEKLYVEKSFNETKENSGENNKNQSKQNPTITEKINQVMLQIEENDNLILQLKDKGIIALQKDLEVWKSKLTNMHGKLQSEGDESKKDLLDKINQTIIGIDGNQIKLKLMRESKQELTNLKDPKIKGWLVEDDLPEPTLVYLNVVKQEEEQVISEESYMEILKNISSYNPDFEQKMREKAQEFTSGISPKQPELDDLLKDLSKIKTQKENTEDLIFQSL